MQLIIDPRLLSSQTYRLLSATARLLVFEALTLSKGGDAPKISDVRFAAPSFSEDALNELLSANVCRVEKQDLVFAFDEVKVRQSAAYVRKHRENISKAAVATPAVAVNPQVSIATAAPAPTPTLQKIQIGATENVQEAIERAVQQAVAAKTARKVKTTRDSIDTDTLSDGVPYKAIFNQYKLAFHPILPLYEFDRSRAIASAKALWKSMKFKAQNVQNKSGTDEDCMNALKLYFRMCCNNDFLMGVAPRKENDSHANWKATFFFIAEPKTVDSNFPTSGTDMKSRLSKNPALDAQYRERFQINKEALAGKVIACSVKSEQAEPVQHEAIAA